MDPVEFRDFMEEAYNDPKFNRYDSGPGMDLPDELQPGALKQNSESKNRQSIGVFLRQIPRELTETGIRNLCTKYGNVLNIRMLDRNEVLRTKCAIVSFGTINDAENCIRSINVCALGIKASFDKKTKKTSQPSQKSLDYEPKAADVNRDGYFVNDCRKMSESFTQPVKLPPIEVRSLLSAGDYDTSRILKDCDPHMDFLNETTNNKVIMKHLKNDKIINGHFNYKQPNAIKNQMRILHEKSLGSLDMEKMEFVHNGGNYVSATGNCKNCGNVTIVYCKGCNEFYCSTQCWEKYNKNKSCKTCRKLESAKQNHHESLNELGVASTYGMEGMDIAQSDAESISPKIRSASYKTRQKLFLKYREHQRSIAKCEVPSNNKLVAITAVINHTTVFLRSMETEANSKFVKYVNNVAEASKTAKALKEMPEIDDIILAEYEGAYYRALVIRIETDMAVVVYLEFGHVDKKPLNQLKELRKDLRNAERFIFKGRLSGVDSELLSDKPLSYLFNLLEAEIPLKFYREDDQFSAEPVFCELTQTDWNENVNSMITTLNFIKTPENVVHFEDIEAPILEGENVTVTILDNSTVVHGSITVIRNENIENLLIMQQRINAYCKQPYAGPYTPMNSEVCLAKCTDDDQWYRVILGDSFGDGNPLMVFIDFGNANLVNVKNMRRMPAEFNYPCNSVFTNIGDIPEDLTDDQIKKLKEYFPLQSSMTAERSVNEDNITTIYFCNLRLD